MQDAFIKADHHFSELVDQVTSDQWSQQSPVTPDWTVAQLVNHVTENNGVVCKTFGGSDELNVDKDSDPAAAWRESAENAETYVRGVSDLDQMVQGFQGEVPAGVFLNMMLTDRLVHSFDLAKAIGADTTLDPELVQLAYDMVLPNKDTMQSSGMFGPEVAVADDAPLQDKLLGMTGRQPV